MKISLTHWHKWFLMVPLVSNFDPFVKYLLFELFGLILQVVTNLNNVELQFSLHSWNENGEDSRDQNSAFYLQIYGDKPPFFIVEYIFEYIYIIWWRLTCKPEKRNWGWGEELWDRGKDSGEPFWADSIKETFLHKNISHFLF